MQVDGVRRAERGKKDLKTVKQVGKRVKIQPKCSLQPYNTRIR